VSNENDNEEVNKKLLQEEMLVAFDKIRRGLELQENITDDLFQSLLKCEHLYENYVLYNKPVQSRTTDFL